MTSVWGRNIDIKPLSSRSQLQSNQKRLPTAKRKLHYRGHPPRMSRGHLSLRTDEILEGWLVSIRTFPFCLRVLVQVFQTNVMENVFDLRYTARHLREIINDPVR